MAEYLTYDLLSVPIDELKNREEIARRHVESVTNKLDKLRSETFAARAKLLLLHKRWVKSRRQPLTQAESNAIYERIHSMSYKKFRLTDEIDEKDTAIRPLLERRLASRKAMLNDIRLELSLRHMEQHRSRRIDIHIFLTSPEEVFFHAENLIRAYYWLSATSFGLQTIQPEFSIAIEVTDDVKRMRISWNTLTRKGRTARQRFTCKSDHTITSDNTGKTADVFLDHPREWFIGASF